MRASRASRLFARVCMAERPNGRACDIPSVKMFAHTAEVLCVLFPYTVNSQQCNFYLFPSSAIGFRRKESETQAKGGRKCLSGLCFVIWCFSMVNGQKLSVLRVWKECVKLRNLEKFSRAVHYRTLLSRDLELERILVRHSAYILWSAKVVVAVLVNTLALSSRRMCANGRASQWLCLCP